MQTSNDIDVVDKLMRSATELRALQRYLVESLELQQSEPALRDHAPVARLFEEILSALHVQIERLDAQLIALPGSRSALQSATATMAGAFIGFLTKTRSHDAEKILRDDFSMLSLVSVHCLMVHTHSVVLGRTNLAETTREHYDELTGLLNELTEIVPIFIQDRLAQQPGSLSRSATVAATGDSETSFASTSILLA